MRAFLKFWLPPLAWMIFIFLGSTDLLSAEHTSRFIGPFLRWLDPNISDTTIGSIQLIVRKCGHLLEYAILAALLYRALATHRDRPFVLAFILAATYAALDEFHQSFVASRTGSPWDVVVDCAGAFVGLLFCSLLRNRRNAARKASEAGLSKSKFEIRK
ncbi:MAG TPA: VanZ family protein [Chthoniobacterales bacterium]|nr:VanZ family protein [Chthoniobacterales bacterium]